MMMIPLVIAMMDWQYTLPPDGTYQGAVYWVQDYNYPWDWEPRQRVGVVTMTLQGDTITGSMNLPKDTVTWWGMLYPVRFYNEETPRDWRESGRYPWLFRVLVPGTSASLSTGEFGRYSEYNIHAQWEYGVSALGFSPECGLRFKWRMAECGIEVYVYGFWTAWPSMHYMSLGWELCGR